jgi:hypothetical protein
VDRLPDAEVEIQFQSRCRIIGRERVPEASLERVFVAAHDLEAEPAQELGQVFAQRRIAELNFDTANVPLELPHAGHLPPQLNCGHGEGVVK